MILRFILGILLFCLQGAQADNSSEDPDCKIITRAWDAHATELNSGDVMVRFANYYDGPTTPTATTEGLLHLFYEGANFQVSTLQWIFTEGLPAPSLALSSAMISAEGAFAKHHNAWVSIGRQEAQGMPVNPRCLGRGILGQAVSISSQLAALGMTFKISEKKYDAWIIDATPARNDGKDLQRMRFRFIVSPTQSFRWTQFQVLTATGRLVEHWEIENGREINGTWVPVKGLRRHYGQENVETSTLQFECTWSDVNTVKAPTSWRAELTPIDENLPLRWSYGRDFEFTRMPSTLPSVPTSIPQHSHSF